MITITGMANTFIKQKGYNIGKSMNEQNQDKFIKEILDESKKNNCADQNDQNLQTN